MEPGPEASTQIRAPPQKRVCLKQNTLQQIRAQQQKVLGGHSSPEASQAGCYTRPAVELQSTKVNLT